MKILIIGDLHIGARNDSEVFRNMMSEYFDNLFSFIKMNNIEAVIQLGDILDKRQSISFITSAFLIKFLSKFDELDVKFYSVLGNHDTYYKNTNTLAGITQYENLFKNVKIFDKPKSLIIDKTEIRFIPWIIPENAPECLQFLEKPSDKYLLICGHFELSGFAYHKNMICEKGSVENNVFENANKVLSGHFHTPSENGKIEYLGTPYKLTWNDYPDKKHFVVFDTNSLNYEYHENNDSLFKKIIYTPGNIEVPNNIPKNGFIKVIVSEFDDLLDTFISKIHEKYTPSNCQIVDVSDNTCSYEEIENLNIDSPYEIMIHAIESLDIKNKDFVKSEIKEIYLQAINSKKE